MHRLRWKLYSRVQVLTSGPKHSKPGSYIGKALNYSAMRPSIRLKKELLRIISSNMKSSRIVKSKSQSVNLNEIISILRIKIITLRLWCRHFLLHSNYLIVLKFYSERHWLIIVKRRGMTRIWHPLVVIYYFITGILFYESI